MKKNGNYPVGTFASIMSGSGTGAISTVQVFGEDAEGILEKIFTSSGAKKTGFQKGEILVGTITVNDNTIDQVTIGCEWEQNFAIHCHANPLIVEMIMRVLNENGVELISNEQMLVKILSADKSVNTIAEEAEIILAKVKTLRGSKIVLNQRQGGVSEKTKQWLSMPLEQIRAEAQKVLAATEIANLIMFGCKIVLTGPANSGKSTLLNCLSGTAKAIVADIKGTTRDYIGAQIFVGELFAEVIDTAGINEKSEGVIERQAQKISLKLLEDADLVLLVVETNRGDEQVDDSLRRQLINKKVLTVINKCDLPGDFKSGEFGRAVRISAKEGIGIEQLIQEIQQVIGTTDFNSKEAVCINERQEEFVRQLSKAETKEQADCIIRELLAGQIRV